MVTGDRQVGPVSLSLTVVPGESEVLLSDKAIDALGIVLTRPGVGLWRFADEPPGRARKSPPRR